eukprot:TRINITY_DN20854_c0_g1_i1.p1 TRINITY_DN20854_c0_g1~~TRINITY_DN20854_c0_g1_i1.p1  ORF type:complete len:319 (+),score=54.20 TRINITY_DN20854_c0_g1_i1:250-1206(+)
MRQHCKQPGDLCTDMPKVEIMIDHLKALDDEEFVVFLDATDVLVNRDLRQLYAVFFTYNASVVVSTERTCWPPEVWCCDWMLEAGDRPGQAVNTGVMMGYAGSMREMLLRAHRLREEVAAHRARVGGLTVGAAILGMSSNTEYKQFRATKLGERRHACAKVMKASPIAWSETAGQDQGWIAGVIFARGKDMGIVLDYDMRMAMSMFMLDPSWYSLESASAASDEGQGVGSGGGDNGNAQWIGSLAYARHTTDGEAPFLVHFNGRSEPLLALSEHLFDEVNSVLRERAPEHFLHSEVRGVGRTVHELCCSRESKADFCA